MCERLVRVREGRKTFEVKIISVVFGRIFGQTENIFSLTEFYITTKRLIFQKLISENQFQSKQTEPEIQADAIHSSINESSQPKVLN